MGEGGREGEREKGIDLRIAIWKLVKAFVRLHGEFKVASLTPKTSLVPYLGGKHQ